MLKRPICSRYCALVFLMACFDALDAGAVVKPALRVTPQCVTATDSFLVEVGLLPRVYHRNVIHRVFLDWNGSLSQPIFTENVPNWTPQWTKKIVVPPGTAVGTHSLRFEQLELFDPPLPGWMGTACAVYLNFKVAGTSDSNPWRDSLISVIDDDTLLLRFDPSLLCGIPRCDSIQLIQTIHPTGLDMASHVRDLSYAEQGFSKAAVLDSERTVAGWRVDVPVDAADPFYTTSMPIGAYVGSPGRSGDTTVVAFLRDAPHRHPSRYPGDIQSVILEFEVCAVCSHGEGAGAYLGRYQWRWTRPRAGPEMITRLGGTREPPSDEFGKALELWRSRHANFTLPVTRYPVVGGAPCQ